LEFKASVGFIHKESITMHDHTIVKKKERVDVLVRYCLDKFVYLWCQDTFT